MLGESVIYYRKQNTERESWRIRERGTNQPARELVQVVKLQLPGKCERPFKLSHQTKTVKGKMRLDQRQVSA